MRQKRLKNTNFLWHFLVIFQNFACGAARIAGGCDVAHMPAVGRLWTSRFAIAPLLVRLRGCAPGQRPLLSSGCELRRAWRSSCAAIEILRAVCPILRVAGSAVARPLGAKPGSARAFGTCMYALSRWATSQPEQRVRTATTEMCLARRGVSWRR